MNFSGAAQCYGSFVASLLAQAGGAGSPPDAPEGAISTGRSLIEYIQGGGWIGYVIIALSIVALTLAIIRLFQIRLSALAPEDVVRALEEMLKKGKINDALAYCQDDINQCFLTRVMGAGLSRYRRSPFGVLELKGALEEAGQEQIARLSRSTDGMAAIASIAPMLGLFGTVVGLYGAFGTMADVGGFARPDQLAGDVSLALVTTIQGLFVAIPTLAAVTWFRNRIDHLASEVAGIVDELAMYVEEQPASAGPGIGVAAAAPPAHAPGLGGVGGSQPVAGGQTVR